MLVEGAEDVAYLASYLQLTGKWAEFRQLGCHFVTVGGKDNMRRPVAIANGFGSPAFVVFDGDCVQSTPEKIAQQQQLNRTILRLCGVKETESVPAGGWFGTRVVAWETTIAKTMRLDVGDAAWEEAVAKARTQHGFVTGVGGKNALLIAAIVEELHSRGASLKALERVCESMLTYAREHAKSDRHAGAMAGSLLAAETGADIGAAAT